MVALKPYIIQLGVSSVSSYIFMQLGSISVCMFDLLPNCSISTMIIDSNLFLDLFYSPCMK